MLNGTERLQNCIHSCVAVGHSHLLTRHWVKTETLASEMIPFLQLCPSQWEEAASSCLQLPGQGDLERLQELAYEVRNIFAWGNCCLRGKVSRRKKHQWESCLGSQPLEAWDTFRHLLNYLLLKSWGVFLSSGMSWSRHLRNVYWTEWKTLHTAALKWIIIFIFYWKIKCSPNPQFLDILHSDDMHSGTHHNCGPTGAAGN